MTEIRNTTLQDIDAAMALARSVMELFPGMDTEEDVQTFGETVKEFVARNEAITATANGGEFAGLLLFSRQEREISYLAVDKRFRGLGLAGRMMKKAMDTLGEGEVFVITFRADHPEGAPARALYQKFGFRDDELMEIAGCPVQKLIRE